MPTTNRTTGAGRVIMNPARPAPAELKLGKFTTNAPGVTVKSSAHSTKPNSPVDVTINRAVRPFSEAGSLSVTLNGTTVKVPVKGTDRPEAIAKKLEKALEKSNPNIEVRIKPSGAWGSQPVGSSKTELVVGLKEHFKPGGLLGPTINPAPRPVAPKPTVNPAPPPPTKPKPTVNPAPPPPTKPKPTVNPAPPPPTKPKPTVNPAPPPPTTPKPTVNPTPPGSRNIR